MYVCETLKGKHCEDYLQTKTAHGVENMQWNYSI